MRLKVRDPDAALLMGDDKVTCVGLLTAVIISVPIKPVPETTSPTRRLVAEAIVSVYAE